MSQVQVLTVSTYPRLIFRSFVEGDRVVPLRPPVRKETEDDVLAHALWLCNHGRMEEAEQYLEDYCRRH